MFVAHNTLGKVEVCDMEIASARILVKSKSLNEHLSESEVEIQLLFTSPAVTSIQDGKGLSFLRLRIHIALNIFFMYFEPLTFIFFVIYN